MYLVSKEYSEKIISNDREFSVKLTFGSSTVLTGATIQDITLDEIVNSSDSLTFGCACSNKITVNLINPPTDIDYENTSFSAEVGLLLDKKTETYEWVPLGKFYVSDTETNNDFKTLKLTAYDGFCKMTRKYIPKLSPSTTDFVHFLADFSQQLNNECGITLKIPSITVNTLPESPDLDITYTQAVGYIAGCIGAIARFDRIGELELVKYTDNGITIERSQQYMSGFKRTTEKPLIITSISTGTEENPIVKGDGTNGTNINFENPYITDDMADDIYNQINNFTYTPCQVKWRGNPAVQAGDLLHVLDKDNTPHTVLVMSQSIKIGGGCNATIDCKGNNETTSNFSNNYESPSQKIDRVYKGLSQAILDATNQITGNSGGYVIIHDTNNDGKPDEILITNDEDITLATKVWRWNKEGLGYSYKPSGNAYLGPYGIAITADGQINADFIATGTLKLGGYDNTSGKFELYDGQNKLLAQMNNEGFKISATNGNYVKLNADDGLAGYDKNDNKIYWADDNVFHMENAEVENEIKIAGKIKIVPVATSENVGVGFVALVQ